ncbi:MAG TPA: NUDIX domain-containing protein [Jatrophihabitantaceae bacterium]|jgi:8-oxo-dGTP diphosphatase|nr:NUDIX domain-containing protein [Jatrophihabitantaceae bacterium]
MAVQVVVAAAVLRDGRVLGARRSAPAELAGQWEFPGGKVEKGESDAEALVRECREELTIEIAVGKLVGTSVISPGTELRLYLAEHLLGFPEAKQDHDATQWFLPAELAAVPWLAADEPLLPRVAALLAPQ